MTRIKSKTIFSIGGVLLAAACGGSSQVPARELSQSEASIRAATEAGAEQHPKAAAHLALAKTTNESARKAAQDGHMDTAKAWFKDAQADADLALALTRSDYAEQKSHEAQQRLEESK